jgi:localization factor PodJL
MTTAGPWSVKGIEPKARELAKDLARRSGMTLGEWLNQMITEVEDEEYAPPPSRPSPVREIRLSSDTELKRITRALDTLTHRMEAAENRSTLAISGIDQQVMGVLARIEGVERDRVAVAARLDSDLEEVRAAQVKVAEKLRRMSDEDGPRMEAMRALEAALGKIAEKLYDGEGKTRAILNEVREGVANSTRRLDRMEARVEAEPAADLIEAVTSRLGDRIIDAENRTALAIKAMEASFAGLDRRLRAAEVADPESFYERSFERLAAELSNKIEANRAELTERLSAAADGKLDRMEATLRDLAGQVAQGERRSAQSIDRMGREVMRIAQTLGDRVGSVEARTAEAAQQMGGDMARIAEAMERRMGRADEVQAEALERLGSEIAKIAERLADRIANAERRSAAAIDDVGEQVGRVTDRLNERYEASQSILAERIRASEERTAKLLDEARETLDRRLIEAQRRSALESVLADTRRMADAEDADRTESAGSHFPDDPFAPLTQAPAAPAAMRSGSASRPAAAAPMDPFVDPTPASALDSRYGDFAADGVEAESFAPTAAPGPTAHESASAFEPMSTRDVVAAARAAARQASERPDAVARGKRRAPDLTGSIMAPPPEDGVRSGFSFTLPKRKKKTPAVNLRTLVVASGTAAALAVTAVGATLYLAAESGSSAGQEDHIGPAPTAALPEEHKTSPSSSTPAPMSNETPPADTLAVALTPPDDAGVAHPRTAAAPADAKGRTAAVAPPIPAPSVPPQAPTPGGLDARAYYNTAVQRLQVGDASGAEDLQKAANLGFAPAQFYLATLYENGASGVKKDPQEARRWMQRAAEAGDARAMHNLALDEFNDGGSKDQADAAHWFKRAADLGVIDSQYNLGRLYERGYGVPENKAEAYKWYLIAANKGDREARVSAEALKRQLPLDQAAAAERAAEGFLAQKQPTLQTARTP